MTYAYSPPFSTAWLEEHESSSLIDNNKSTLTRLYAGLRWVQMGCMSLLSADESKAMLTVFEPSLHIPLSSGLHFRGLEK